MAAALSQTEALPQATTTLWRATSPPQASYPPLKGDIEADVAILGGGITGLAAAMYLDGAGKKVVLLESGRIGSGTTGGTSGHLDAMPDQGVKKLGATFGETAARMVTQARMDAIEQIETWCREMTLDCDFRRVAAYVYSESAEGAAALETECETARRLGLATAMTEPPGLPFAHGGFRIENQARFHSLRFVQGIADRLHRNGVAVHEQSQALPPKDGQPCELQTSGGRVSARDVVLATHSSYLGISGLDLLVAPYQSYVLTARVDSELPDALYWDDAKPYHYIRLASSDDRKLLVIGGADHKTGQGGDERRVFEQLEDYAHRRFHVESIEHRWSAGLFEPADGLPYIGRAPFSGHLYIGTGYSGTGLTFGVVAGRLLADLVLGRGNPLADVLSPSRVKLSAAAGNVLSENANVAYRFVADRFSGEEIKTLEEIPSGKGRLVHFRGKQLAVYRDDQGAVHAFSPVCTHAGCCVQWNEFESTWDCPCHGGRFSALGERIYGPPPKDLDAKPLDEL